LALAGAVETFFAGAFFSAAEAFFGGAAFFGFSSPSSAPFTCSPSSLAFWVHWYQLSSAQSQTQGMFTLERGFDAGAFLGFSASSPSSAASASSSDFYE